MKQDNDIAARAAAAPPPEWDQLLIACQRNDVDKARLLMDEEGIPATHGNVIGQTALHVASLWGHVEMMGLLLDRGAKSNVGNQISGATPLHMALSSSKTSAKIKLRVVQLLLSEKGGARVDLCDTIGAMPLDFLNQGSQEFLDDPVSLAELKKLLTPSRPMIFVHISTNDSAGLEKVIQQDPQSINAMYMEQTPVAFAVQDILELVDNDNVKLDDLKTKVGLLHMLINAGAQADKPVFQKIEDIAKQDGKSDEGSCFHQVALVLQSAMSDKSEEGESVRAELLRTLRVLHESTGRSNAATSGEEDIRKEAFIPTCSQELLTNFARRGWVDLVQLWVSDFQVDPNITNRQGMTPLHFAARSNQVDVAQLLLAMGSDVAKQDQRGQMASQAAQANGHERIVALLGKHLQ